MHITRLQQLVGEIRRLTPEQQLLLMGELVEMIRLRMQEAAQANHSITKPEDSGKKSKEGVDAQQYVEEERNS